MIDWTKPIQTKDGKPVEIITISGRLFLYPVIGYIGTETSTSTWTKDGKYMKSGHRADKDLENVPPPKKVTYVNIYPHAVGYAAP